MENRMKIIDMIEKSLRYIPCDGIYNPHLECACIINHEHRIIPCDELTPDCRAGNLGEEIQMENLESLSKVITAPVCAPKFRYHKP